MNKQNSKNQQGFIILMGMLVLVLGAAVWFGSIGNIRSESIQISVENENVNTLYRIKDKMLTYAMFQPEIFRTLSSNVTPLAQERIPGPGYFPCPDITDDGVSDAPCAGSGVTFVTGVVPQKISSRLFSFSDKSLESKSFWYAVDSRFLTQNGDYYYDSAYKRFVPLNNTSPAIASLTLDGTTDIVMVLIYSGDPLGNQNQSSAKITDIGNFLELENADGDADFISVFADSTQFNDIVIPITRNEWNAAILSRVSMDADGNNVPDLCVDPAAAVGTFHWFNDCFSSGTNFLTCDLNTASTDENLYGQGWRTVLGCP